MSDTSPLHYLAVLGEIDLLSRLFERVYCPLEVLAECRHAHAPDMLQAWAAALPSWVVVQPAPSKAFAGLERLDAGEAAAIRLASHLSAVLLIDERKGCIIAANAGLQVAGVLALLAKAASLELLDFDGAVQRLRARQTSGSTTMWSRGSGPASWSQFPQSHEP